MQIIPVALELAFGGLLRAKHAESRVRVAAERDRSFDEIGVEHPLPGVIVAGGVGPDLHGPRRVFLRIIHIQGEGDANLTHYVHAGQALGAGLALGDGREEQPDNERDNYNHSKEFQKGEPHGMPATIGRRL